MEHGNLIKRFGASVLSLAMVLSTVPPVGAAESVVGTIQVSGPAWVASPNADWSRLSSTRPLVAGDRLKTGSDGYLLADLGDAGVVGLYGDAEVATTQAQGAGPVVDVHKGKVAFHISPNSRMKLNAQGSAIASGERAADGYVEYNAAGVPVVVVEDGSLNVQMAAGDLKTVGRGERLSLGANAAAGQPVQVAEAEDDDRKAGAAASEEGSKTYAGLSASGWTAVAVVAGAIGGTAWYGADHDDGDDDNGTPSGE